MSYPYYTLPLQLYENLPEILRQNGYDVTVLPPRGLQEHAAGTRIQENETSKSLIVNIENNIVKIIYYLDTSLGQYTAYALLDCNSKPLPNGLKRHLDLFLEKHGAVMN